MITQYDEEGVVIFCLHGGEGLESGELSGDCRGLVLSTRAVEEYVLRRAYMAIFHLAYMSCKRGSSGLVWAEGSSGLVWAEWSSGLVWADGFPFQWELQRS